MYTVHLKFQMVLISWGHKIITMMSRFHSGRSDLSRTSGVLQSPACMHDSRCTQHQHKDAPDKGMHACPDQQQEFRWKDDVRCKPPHATVAMMNAMHAGCDQGSLNTSVMYWLQGLGQSLVLPRALKFGPPIQIWQTGGQHDS